MPSYPSLQDFYRLGGEDKGWNVDICKLDSDKDGATNGQELGDPDCTVSTVPTWSAPGVPLQVLLSITTKPRSSLCLCAFMCHMCACNRMK